MKKQFRRGLALFIAVLMLTCNLPFVALADDDTGIKISSNVTVSDVEVADDIEFSYYIEIDRQPFNGTATGSDGETYDVVDGILKMPYKVSAVLDNVAEGSYYSVKRLEYDNDNYALIKETAAQEGEFTGIEYYVSYDGGEKQLITEAEYKAATENGTNTTYTVYRDADGNVYDSSQISSMNAYESVQGSSLGSTTYTFNAADYYYVTDSRKDYDLSFTLKITGYSTGFLNYKYSGSLAISFEGYDGPLNGDANIDFTGTQGVNQSGAASNFISSAKTNIGRLTFRFLSDTINAETGLKAVIAEDVSAKLPASGDLSTSSEQSFDPIESKAYAFTQVTQQTAEYTFEEVPASKDLVFDATFAPAPTGSFGIDYIIYDGVVPAAYAEAEFEIKDSNGRVLIADVDYTLEVNDNSISILGTSYGYTVYMFSGLKHGDYTVRQTKGADGYVVDTTTYSFNVAREDGAVTGDNFDKSGFGSHTALTNNTWSILGLYTFKVFKNNSISITFHKVDQNDEPVQGAEFLLIDRTGLINFVTDMATAMATAAPDIISGLDFDSILEQISSTDWSSIDVGTILGLILSIATVDSSVLPNLTIPAILTSTSDADGLVELNNSKNILNTVGSILDSGLISGDQLAEVLETVFGSVIPEEYLPLLDTLAGMSDSIHITTGFKAGSYILIETSAPTGYERNSTIFTFTLNNDGTAYVSTGVIFPVIVDAINNQFGVNLTDFFLTEEQFEEYAGQLNGAFNTFNEYADFVLTNVIDFIGEIFGEDTEAATYLDNLRNNLEGYYEQYVNLEEAIRGIVQQVNQYLSDPIDDDFRYLDTRYFVDINIDIADCLGGVIDGIQYVVTDANGNVIELNEDGVSVTVPFGDYTIAVSNVPDGYALNDTSITTVTVNDANGEYAFVVTYHNYNDGDTVSNDDGETHRIQCAGYETCGSALTENCTWSEIEPKQEPQVDVAGKEATYECDVCGQTKGGEEIPALIKTYNVTIVSKPLGATEVQYYEQGVLKTAVIPATEEYGAQTTTVQADHDTQIVLTATPNENVEFVGWMVNTSILKADEDGIDNPHDATVLADITYEPIFQYVYDEDDTFTVVFTDKFGNIYSTQTVDSGDDIIIPDGPVLVGHTFTGWSLTDNEIYALTSATTIYAKYTVNADVTYTVTAEGATITTPDGEYSGIAEGIIYGSKITVSADGATSWKINNATVGYGDSYTFYLGDSVTITYSTDDVKETPVVAAVSTTSIGSDGNIKASFLATRSLVDGYTYVNSGFIYGADVDNSDLTLGNVDQDAIRAYYCTTNVEQFCLNVARSSQSGTISAKAFLAYVDESGDGSTEVVYTDFVPFDYDA